jgi:hypothetical protein
MVIFLLLVTVYALIHLVKKNYCHTFEVRVEDQHSECGAVTVLAVAHWLGSSALYKQKKQNKTPLVFISRFICNISTTDP